MCEPHDAMDLELRSEDHMRPIGFKWGSQKVEIRTYDQTRNCYKKNVSSIGCVGLPIPKLSFCTDGECIFTVGLIKFGPKCLISKWMLFGW